MTIKGPSRKQVIIPMNSDNIMRFMKKSNLYVSNLNRALRNIKSNVLVNFIHLDLLDITIITYKIASTYDLQVIKNYVKSVNCIDTTSIEVPCFLQSKSYLKIIGILYYQENSLNPITLKVVEDIVKQNQIFDNIVLMSKLCVIKVFPRLDMAIVWLDIWDIQSSSKTKGLINQYFYVMNYITTIREINMNLGVLQCKNCWKWSYVTFSYKI